MNGGGGVTVNSKWTQAGGTQAIITAATPYSGVWIHDWRGQSQYFQTVQPSTISLISAPATLSAATVTQAAACPTGSTCSWTAETVHFCVAYVDLLGQLSACSADFNSAALTASLPVNIAAPAASSGAVGWVAFANNASYNAAFLLPVVSTAGVANGACTLTTLETAFPACALTNTSYGQTGSAASFVTKYANTNIQTPFAAQSTTNISNPIYQAHTTFAYAPSASEPAPFQYNFDLWPANTASESASDITVLGTVNLPLGYLNQIGRSIRVSGKIIATVTTASTPEVIILDGWQGGYTAGVPSKALCTMLAVGTPTGTSDVFSFTCTITTQAVGTTAVGSILANGTGVLQASTALPIAVIDNGTATTVSSIGLFTYNQLFIEWINTATASTAARLLDLHVETII